MHDATPSFSIILNEQETELAPKMFNPTSQSPRGKHTSLISLLDGKLELQSTFWQIAYPDGAAMQQDGVLHDG